MGTRLVKYLAQCGVASRRGAAEVVRSGLVAVNGQTSTNVALQVEPGDEVTVEGRRIESAGPLYYLLNKPAGVVCSRSDPHNPETVLDCLPAAARAKVKPVGRLDKDATGVLLLTDDGDLAFRLTHPRYGVDKTYVAKVRGKVTERTAEKLAAGVVLDDGPTSPAQVRILSASSAGSNLEITIHEGRNRQVKRMCEAVGHRVEQLRRTRFGPLALDRQLGRGQARELSAGELAALRRAAGL